jgi:hypothetical protein
VNTSELEPGRIKDEESGLNKEEINTFKQSTKFSWCQGTV